MLRVRKDLGLMDAQKFPHPKRTIPNFSVLGKEGKLIFPPWITQPAPSVQGRENLALMAGFTLGESSVGGADGDQKLGFIPMNHPQLQKNQS